MVAVAGARPTTVAANAAAAPTSLFLFAAHPADGAGPAGAPGPLSAPHSTAHTFFGFA